MRLTIRFSPRTHSVIKHEAEREGVTITQFVREAALARAYYAKGLRGERPPEGEQALEQARDTLHEDDGRRHRT